VRLVLELRFPSLVIISLLLYALFDIVAVRRAARVSILQLVAVEAFDHEYYRLATAVHTQESAACDATILAIGWIPLAAFSTVAAALFCVSRFCTIAHANSSSSGVWFVRSSSS
jgi:hypothetical protein